MRFTVDQNLPVEAAQLLQEAGQEAATVLDQDLGGREDGAGTTICQQEARAFITLALDWAAMRTYPLVHHAGMVV